MNCLQKKIDLQHIVIDILEAYKNIAINDATVQKPMKRRHTLKDDSDPLQRNLEQTAIYIKALYPQLYEFLTAHPSKLNFTEILICCFVHAGFSADVICTLLRIKKESFYVLRSRIRENWNTRLFFYITL